MRLKTLKKKRNIEPNQNFTGSYKDKKSTQKPFLNLLRDFLRRESDEWKNFKTENSNALKFNKALTQTCHRSFNRTLIKNFKS